MRIFLKDILIQRQMSVNELHKLTGISRTTLDPLAKSDYLPLKTRFDTIQRIADNLNLPISDVINFEESSTSYEISVLKADNKSFDGYTREYIDRIVLKVYSSDGRYFLLMLTSQYSPDEYFDEKYKFEIDQLDKKLDEIRTLDDYEKDKANKEFDDLYERMVERGMSYTGKKVFSTNYSFYIKDLSDYLDVKQFLPTDYINLFKNSTHLSKVIGNEDFIKSVSTFISNMYKLKENIITRHLEINEREISELPYENTNYIFMVYESCVQNIKKTIVHEYFL